MLVFCLLLVVICFLLVHKNNAHDDGTKNGSAEIPALRIFHQGGKENQPRSDFIKPPPLQEPKRHITQHGEQVSTRSLRNVPHTSQLTYPAILPSFDRLATGRHEDPRATLYTILHIDIHRKRSFSATELSALDFGAGKSGNKNACKILMEKGLIRHIDRERILAELYTVPELKVFLREMGLSCGGNKPTLIKRLLENGFKVNRSSYRYQFLELTESGIGAIEEYYADEKRAYFLAVDALKVGDYSGAVSAYRKFDGKWGFVHASGKKHTIFAHCDIPFSQFEFIARYPMRELQNSDDFKNTLRACLIAGLMGKGCPYYYVGEAFQEPIQCPNIVSLYACDGGVDPAIISAMQENVKSDNSYVLKYYISRVMYLSRQARA